MRARPLLALAAAGLFTITQTGCTDGEAALVGAAIGVGIGVALADAHDDDGYVSFSAGPDVVAWYPDGVVSLSASWSVGSDITVQSVSWDCLTASSTAVIWSPTSPTTWVSVGGPGVYQFRCTIRTYDAWTEITSYTIDTVVLTVYSSGVTMAPRPQTDSAPTLAIAAPPAGTATAVLRPAVSLAPSRPRCAA